MEMPSQSQLAGKKRTRLCAVLLASVGMAAATGQADAQISVQSVANSDIGNVVSAATGDTTFQVSASAGTVTKLSGNAVRLSTGTTRSLVTIYCTDPPAKGTPSCKGHKIKVEIGSNGSISGRARSLTAFNVSPVSFTIGSQTGSNPLTFTSTQNIAANTAWTFYVGMNFPIAGNDSGLATGTSTSGFYVWVCTPNCTPSSTRGSSGLAVASVWRPISLAASNLVFGNITRPRTGSGSVTLTPTGTRTVTGTGAYGFPLPTPSPASYTVSGEGGQLISVTIPVSFVMTRSGGADTITVTTSNNVLSTPSLNSTLGNAGIYTFNVGGSFPLNSATPLGTYSGTFNVTVQYN